MFLIIIEPVTKQFYSFLLITLTLFLIVTAEPYVTKDSKVRIEVQK